MCAEKANYFFNIRDLKKKWFKKPDHAQHPTQLQKF